VKVEVNERIYTLCDKADSGVKWGKQSGIIT
jgi:hypothetical protein